MKDNYLFLKEVKNLVEKTNCELKVCFQYVNRGDRWIQVRNPGLGGTGPMATQELASRQRPGTQQLPVWEFCYQIIHAHRHRDTTV